jgi:hypothetical protein
MFADTFDHTGFTGPIPENLFKDIQGPPASGMFSGALWSCTGLTIEIPGDLVAGISCSAAFHKL